MKILLINNDGAGFADYVTIDEGITVGQLFESRIGRGKEHNYLIRVNRLPTPVDQVLREGDRISITPVKIEGACSNHGELPTENAPMETVPGEYLAAELLS